MTDSTALAVEAPLRGSQDLHGASGQPVVLSCDIPTCADCVDPDPLAAQLCGQIAAEAIQRVQAWVEQADAFDRPWMGRADIQAAEHALRLAWRVRDVPRVLEAAAQWEEAITGQTGLARYRALATD